jgi:hypothetical protein
VSCVKCIKINDYPGKDGYKYFNIHLADIDMDQSEGLLDFEYFSGKLDQGLIDSALTV